MVFILLSPMILEGFFASNLLPIAQRLFPFWDNKPVTIFLSDLFFIEAAVFLIFGALITGVILYNAWANLDVRQTQFTESIWNWRRIKEERVSSAGLKVGLTVLAIGIIYVVSAIVVSA